MTKITIKATNLEITVDGTQVEGTNDKLTGLLAALLGRLVEKEADGEVVDESRMISGVDVLAFIRDYPGSNIEEIAGVFGMDEFAATMMLAKMEAHGQVVHAEVDGQVTFTVPADATESTDVATEPTAETYAGEVTAASGDCGCSQVSHTSSLPSTPQAAYQDATDANVLAFLRSGERFEYRTYNAISKQFGGSGVGNTLDDLIDRGDVTTKRRRADGATLYKAAALPVEPAVAYPEFNLQNLREFLTSDPRYTKRTAKAIAKHFGVAQDDFGFSDRLYNMADDGGLRVTSRRRDGVDLFRVE